MGRKATGLPAHPALPLPAARDIDQQIVRLALPALGALAAEPSYVLVDTAIVGHIGTTPLAALAIAATVLTSAFAIFNFLTYGTTAQVARLHGAGRPAEAAAIGGQAAWLSLGIGAALLVALVVLARPIVAAMGGTGATADGAAAYLRISALGAPCFLLAAAGQGFLRGRGDLRTPLVILLAANGVNALLEVLFVFGFGWGLEGSAWGTVIAQVGMALAFGRIQWRAGWPGPDGPAIRRLARVGGQIAVRTTSLLAVFLVCSGVLARVGDATVAAHQIGYQLFLFIALVLDAVAIAGQVMTGRALGAGDAALARAAGRRMIGWSVLAGGAFAVVLTALSGVLPGAFTADDAVVEQAGRMWPLLVAMMPFNGAVFALDGILIGAGDTRFLALAMLLSAVVAIPLALLALAAGWGIVGVWGALCAFVGVRLVTCLARFAGPRWAATGATAR